MAVAHPLPPEYHPGVFSMSLALAVEADGTD